MSDVNAVRFLLANNGSLTAVVQAARIYAGVLPQGIALPAISVTHVSTIRPQLVAQSYRLCMARVQITVFAATYESQKAVTALCRAALPRSRGLVNGVAIESIIPDIEGPDFTDESGLYIGSIDYRVTYTE